MFRKTLKTDGCGSDLKTRILTKLNTVCVYNRV